MNHTYRWATALALMASGMLLPGAAAQAQTTRTLTDGSVTLAVEEGRARVDHPDGRHAEVSLPAAVDIQGLARDRDGWLLAGVETVGGDDELRLFRLTADPSAAVPELHPLPVPAHRPGQRLQEPVPLIAGGELRALAWLQGTGGRTLAVQSSRWQDDAWIDVEMVAEPGPGSQLALTGDVTADGAVVLAWSRYDGSDDEIFWSRGTADGWSVPAALADNAVPDIAPRLATVDGQALLAWSRYDGDHYRLHLARLTDDGWRPVPLATPPGSLFPTFTRHGETTLMIYRTARPRGWTVVELGSDGEPLRQAPLRLRRAVRPRILSLTEGGPRVSWPGREEGRLVPWEELSGGETP